MAGALALKTAVRILLLRPSQSSLYYIDKHAWPAVSGNIFQLWLLGGKQNGGRVQKRPISGNFHTLAWAAPWGAGNKWKGQSGRNGCLPSPPDRCASGWEAD